MNSEPFVRLPSEPSTINNPSVVSVGNSMIKETAERVSVLIVWPQQELPEGPAHIPFSFAGKILSTVCFTSRRSEPRKR